MKNLIYIPLALGILSCDNSEKATEKEAVENKDYVVLSGKITNLKDGDLIINNYNKTFDKAITVNEDGTFNDTLDIPDTNANYFFSYGGEYANLFLKNGAELSFTLDTEEFDESLRFEGTNAKENNYLIEKTLAQGEMDLMALIAADNEDFEEDVEKELNKIKSLLEKHTDLDTTFYNSETQNIPKLKDKVYLMHTQAIEKAEILSKLTGNPSPTFKDYKTPEDKLVSLDQFKGKYTYIDIWATWCGPCKAEIPDMIEFNNTEAAKKMNFISLSVDEDKAIDAWKEMIIEKEMNWHQLRADSAWKSDFITAYSVNSIPRFILLDPKGNVVNPDAPRPSSEEFKAMIADLNL